MKYAAAVCKYMEKLSKAHPEVKINEIPYGDLAYGEALEDWNQKGKPANAFFSYAPGQIQCPTLMAFRKELSLHFGLEILTIEEGEKRRKLISTQTKRVKELGFELKVFLQYLEPGECPGISNPDKDGVYLYQYDKGGNPQIIESHEPRPFSHFMEISSYYIGPKVGEQKAKFMSDFLKVPLIKTDQPIKISIHPLSLPKEMQEALIDEIKKMPTPYVLMQFYHTHIQVYEEDSRINCHFVTSLIGLNNPATPIICKDLESFEI